MEHLRIRIHKELSGIREKYFGFTVWQWLSVILCLGIDIPLYIVTSAVLGSDLASYLVILVGAPILLCGFLRLQQLSFAKFALYMYRHYWFFAKPLRVEPNEKDKKRKQKNARKHLSKEQRKELDQKLKEEKKNKPKKEKKKKDKKPRQKKSLLKKKNQEVQEQEVYTVEEQEPVNDSIFESKPETENQGELTAPIIQEPDEFELDF